MYIRSESGCEAFVANDGCSIIELLHPKHMPTGLGSKLDFSLAVAEVQVNEQTYRHILDQHEVYYMLSGDGEMHIDAETANVKAGDAIFIPAGSTQWIKNVGSVPLRFAAIVAPPWTPEGDHLLEAK